MFRTALIFAIIVVAATAFVVPANQVVARSAAVEAPKMVAEMSQVVENANLIASSVGDFGGYFFPVTGIAGLSALILFLAPPLADE